MVDAKDEINSHQCSFRHDHDLATLNFMKNTVETPRGFCYDE